jgi:hypothetical protein
VLALRSRRVSSFPKGTTMNDQTGQSQKLGNGASAMLQGREKPRQGEHYRCPNCGMEVEIVEACRCSGSESEHFHCCGRELQKV